MPFLCNNFPDFQFEVSIRYFLFYFIFLKSGTILCTASANEFALSFPWIPIWLGIQQNITFLLWFMELSLFRSLTKGLSSFAFLRGCRTEMESEWMNFSLLLVETSLSAKFIAQILVENMETSFERNFFKVFLWRTVPHLVP